jgi:hypothetical protein
MTLVCGVEVRMLFNACTRLEEAEGDDAFVTHATQCGACSSAKT